MRHLPQTRRNDPTSLLRARGAARARSLAGAAAVGMLALLTGCEADSFFDPSVLGRWEVTPTTVPVLDRIAAIEHDDAGFVETSDVTPEDLIPVAAEYRITTGDQLIIKIRDFNRTSEEAEFERAVDKRGYIDLPRLPPIRVQGLTPVQARDAIAAAIREADLLKEATVSVVPQQQRQQTFSAFGAVQTPGTYFIPSPDYRLLQALTAAGGFSEAASSIYVIRQVPLGEASGAPTGHGPATPGGGNPAAEPPKADRLEDLLRDLQKPGAGTPPAPSTPPASSGADTPKPPATPPPPPPSPAVYPDDGGPRLITLDQITPSQPAKTAQPPRRDQPPPIDIPETGKATAAPESAPAGAMPVRGNASWTFFNGQWVKVSPVAATEAGGQPTGAPRGAASDVLVAQRVIKIPTSALIAGAAKYNIVVRPGDIIRVPSNLDQFFYVEGQIARPGVFSIPRAGITLTRGIAAAGGLSQIAIPERVDLTRMVGGSRQATIRLNLRAIAEGTQPDVYLKNDDLVNIGTNFWAFPLAVIRNGFRASYGFGLIVDRNFGSDVFGVPPEAKVRNGF